MPPEKKKATRGQKQIVEENKATITFYRNMSLIAVVVYFISCALYWHNTRVTDIVLIVLGIIVHISCLYFMRYMARAKYSEFGKLLDGGLDLNMEDAIGDHLKDAIILTSAIEILAVFCRYFWLLWLLAPCRLVYILWTKFSGFSFSQPENEQPQVESEKKQKKGRTSH